MEKKTIAPSGLRSETKSVAYDETPDGAAVGGLCLLVSAEAGVQVIPLSVGTSVLGRAEGVSIRVADDSVSRRHARLVIEDGRVTLADLGSRNGTRIDGERAPPNVPMELHVGSSFELGATTIVLHRARGFLNEDPSRAGLPQSPAPFAGESAPIVHDPAMKRLYKLLDVVGPSPLAILVLGETGVGKEVFAETIHKRSTRASEAFLQLNCAALPESLLEAELFGYERGAFTGAQQAKAGLFESADRGTIFLDEVGEIPLGTQAKLLRVLESGEVLRIGSLKPRTVDARFISATNRDLRALILEGRFRSDLYFRLNGMTMRLPPLRKRKADIVPLAEHFLKRTAARLQRDAPSLSPAAAAVLERHAWPGNVRELKNAIERAVVMCTARVLGPEDLHLEEEDLSRGAEEVTEERPSDVDMPTVATGRLSIPASERPSNSVRRNSKLEDLSKQAILDALNKAAGNQSEAARMLGISRRALVYRIEAYGVARPRKR